jgi:hypothetical protein
MPRPVVCAGSRVSWKPKARLASAPELDRAELVLVVVHPLGSHSKSCGQLARGEPLILRCVETPTVGQDLCDPTSDPLGKVLESVRLR